MSDQLLDAAKAEYLELKRKRTELQKETDAVDSRLEDLEEFFRVAKSVYPALKSPLEERAPLRFKPKFVNLKATIVALSEELMRGGKKMQTRDILAEAEKRNIRVGGKNEKNRVLHTSAILSRSGRFKASPEGWSLESEQLPLTPKSEGRSARTLRPSVAA